MSSKAKRMKKNLTAALRFPADMYGHTLGSLVISAMILKGEDIPQKELGRIKRRWKTLKKNPEKHINFWLDDVEFVDKSLALFKIERPDYFPIAMIKSNFNVLFLPYEDGEVFAIREDGHVPPTARHGDVYPINWDDNEKK